MSEQTKTPQSKKASWESGKEDQKILLVEDNWDHAYLTMTVLAKEGRYQVEHAASAAEALYLLMKGKIVLALVDYNMAGMSGLDLIRKIRALNLTLPIIMVTGLGSESVAVEAMKNGAYDYIVKSGNYLDVLPILIDRALKKHELEVIKESWDQWIFQRNLELGVLNVISATLAKSLKLDEVLKQAVDKTVEVMQADDGQIWLTDELAEAVSLAVPSAADGSAGTVIRISSLTKPGPLDDTLQKVMGTAESVVVENPSDTLAPTNPGLPKQSLGSVAYIPLASKGKILGILVLSSHRKHHFTREHTKLLNAIGNQIGSALENARLYEEIRKQAGRITESENKYRALVEGANDAVLIVQDDRVQYANKKAAELTGYDVKTLCRTELLDLVTPEDKDSAATYYAAKMSGKDVPNCEIVVVQNDGREITLELSGSLIEYQGRLALQIIARDVTEQKYLREQLIQSKKLSALGHFVSGVAHELHNPLSSAQGYVQILMQEDLSESAKGVVNKITGEIKRATETVQNLLAFARQRKLEKMPVDLNELIERTLALRAYKLTMDHVEVIKELKSDLPCALVDPIQMQLVFLNIIINAEQAMRESHQGGKLVIRTSLVSSPGYEVLDDVETPLNRFASWIKIEFIDNGPGVNKKSLAEIFDPFFTTKEMGKGTGLGLSIAYGMIKEHSGDIYALSEEGKGATFVIRLPVPKIGIL
jgi:PAS domain S-box-containing protein